MRSLHRQQGYLLLVAVMLIVIVGFIGSAMGYIFFAGSMATANAALTADALYLAESGLENSARLLLTPNLTTTNQRLACSAITGASTLTNQSFGSGEYTVTAVNSTAYDVTTTLSSAMTATDTTLSMSSTTGFAPYGRVLIDEEAIDYSAISGSTLIGLQRGANDTLASSHTNTTQIAQYQCLIHSVAGVPTISASTSSKELIQAVQLQDAWVVGPRSGNFFVLAEWNNPNELQWTNRSFSDTTNRTNLSSISLLSNADGWAVGATIGTNFIILRLQGSTWAATPFAGACSASQNLTGVSAVSSREAWAVGVNDQVSCTSGNWRYTILRWNGTTWTELTPSTTPSLPADGSSATTNPQLNDVHVVDTNGDGLGNIGFSVGNNGRILKYTGTQWIQDASPVTTTLLGVFVTSASEAWAVGAGGRILRWNGTTWSTVTSPTTTQLNDITMIDTNGDGLADAGWAVGNAGVGVRYNGTSWSLQNPSGTALSKVAMFSADDAWATGTNGRITHWDGTSWTNASSPIAGTLTGIAVIPQGTKPTSAWQEVF